MVFQANNSARINIWDKSLENPCSQQAFGNNENNTTTLSLETSYVGELGWNQGTPPEPLQEFQFYQLLWQNQLFLSCIMTIMKSLCGPEDIFSSNNSGQWINGSWAAFSS